MSVNEAIYEVQFIFKKSNAYNEPHLFVDIQESQIKNLRKPFVNDIMFVTNVNGTDYGVAVSDIHQIVIRRYALDGTIKDKNPSPTLSTTARAIEETFTFSS